MLKLNIKWRSRFFGVSMPGNFEITWKSRTLWYLGLAFSANPFLHVGHRLEAEFNGIVD